MKIIFLLFQFTIQAQVKPVQFDTKILYKFTYHNDSTSSASRKSVFTQLMVGDQESHFQTLSKFRSDSALSLSSFKIGIFYNYGSIPLTNFLIIKKDDMIYTYEPVNGIGFDGNNELSNYEEKKEDMQWESHPDTVHLHQFICQKATTNWGGRKWTAWFTMDIPISDGPYKFCGLPGLVLSVSDQDKYFTFDIASISKVKSVSLILDQLRPDLDLQKTTKDAFYKDRKNLRNNMTAYALATGTRLDEVAKRRVTLDTKTDNNHIERY